jgi:aspartate/methionine/tyrosine aminotransferase
VYEKRSRIAYGFLKDIAGIVVNQTNGAFYMTVMFRENVLTANQRLSISNAAAKEMVERLVKDVALDKRFVYYLLAATGICVVPLTGFNCDLRGFRVTLLESDDAKFEWIFRTLGEKITEYLQSQPSS